MYIMQSNVEIMTTEMERVNYILKGKIEENNDLK